MQNRAFAVEIAEFFKGVIDCPKRNIISFGDSAHEREAIMNVTKWVFQTLISAASTLEYVRRAMEHEHVTKSLKFVERPMIEQLKKVIAHASLGGFALVCLIRSTS